jgi:hypothetical protein
MPVLTVNLQPVFVIAPSVFVFGCVVLRLLRRKRRERRREIEFSLRFRLK